MGQDHLYMTLVGEVGEQHDAVGDAKKSMHLYHLYRDLQRDVERHKQALVCFICALNLKFRPLEQQLHEQFGCETQLKETSFVCGTLVTLIYLGSVHGDLELATITYFCLSNPSLQFPISKQDYSLLRLCSPPPLKHCKWSGTSS